MSWQMKGDYASNELYGLGQMLKHSTAEYNNLDIYQINSTYYSALGDDDRKYFLARLIQASHQVFHKCIMLDS